MGEKGKAESKGHLGVICKTVGYNIVEDSTNACRQRK